MSIETAKPSVFDAGLPILDYDFTATPQEIYPQVLAAQQQAPIALGPIGPEVLSYELARTVLGDPRFGIPPGIHLTAHGVTSGELWDRVTRSILCMEGADYRRLRSLVSRAFTPRATARMDTTVHVVINDLIDAVEADRRCEFVDAIARPYPIPVICALLDAPSEDWKLFSKWAEDIFKVVSFDIDLVAEEPSVLRAWDAFDEYVDDMIAHRRTELTHDLLSEPDPNSPGEHTCTEKGHARGLTIHPGSWHIEYGRGAVATTLPFAMVETLLVSLEFESVRRSTVEFARLIRRRARPGSG